MTQWLTNLIIIIQLSISTYVSLCVSKILPCTTQWLQAHSSVEKAGMIGFVRLRVLTTDSQFRLTGETLKSAMDVSSGVDKEGIMISRGIRYLRFQRSELKGSEVSDVFLSVFTCQNVKKLRLIRNCL